MRYWLLDKRNAMRMRQIDVGKRVGISQSEYSKIERGNVYPRVKTAKKIAAVLGVNWVDFFPDGASIQAENKQHFVKVQRVKVQRVKVQRVKVTANRKGMGV